MPFSAGRDTPERPRGLATRGWIGRRGRIGPRGRVGRRALVAALALIALILASVLLLTEQTSPRGRGLESIFEDDQLLVDQPLTTAGTAKVVSTLATLKSLGVDTVRVIVVWRQVAPDPTSSSRPAGFDARDPADYGNGWATYDRVDAAAALDGITVDFDLTGPAPNWAVTPQPSGTRAAAVPDADVYAPSPAAFAQFAEAAGKRYGGQTVSSQTAGHALPRVHVWSVWNEPNQPGWLSPQLQASSSTPAAPALYRSLLDAAWSGLAASGHTVSTDTILFGELAPEGCVSGGACAFAGLGNAYRPIPPVTFLDALYCVAPSNAGPDVQLRGAAARAVGCPVSANASQFVSEHPALFRASGLSEHPYSFKLAPNVPFPLASESAFAPLASLGRLTSTLDDAYAVYGVGRKLDLYLTEYGYVTNPPNPDYSVSPAQQALYLDQATYIAAQNPRVRALGQFELQDVNPAVSCGCTRASPKYWQTFEEGLEYLGGRPKPSLAAYRLPIFLPGLESPTREASPGQSVEVWGMLRAAANNSTQTALIQWQPTAGGAYRTLATTTTRNPSGIISQRVTLPGSGNVRLLWRPPAGTLVFSRTVAVTVR